MTLQNKKGSWKMKNNKLIFNKKVGLLTTAIIISSSGYAAFDEGAAVLYATTEKHFIYDGLPFSYTESYFVDLGVTGQDLVNAVSVTVHDAGLGAWLNTRSDTQWGVISTVNDPSLVAVVAGPPAPPWAPPSYTNSGIVGTSYTGSTVSYNGQTNEQLKSGINDLISVIQSESNGLSSFSFKQGENETAISPQNHMGFYNSMIGVGSVVPLFYVQADPSPGASLIDNVITSQIGTMGTPFQSAAFLSSDGTFTANAVPIPAAAWLFGSALAGLGVARRKK